MMPEVTETKSLGGTRAIAWASHGLGNRTDFAAGVVAASVASLLINWVRPDDSTGTLAMLLDLAISL